MRSRNAPCILSPLVHGNAVVIVRRNLSEPHDSEDGRMTLLDETAADRTLVRKAPHKFRMCNLVQILETRNVNSSAWSVEGINRSRIVPVPPGGARNRSIHLAGTLI